MILLPQSMADELTTEDAEWLLNRVKAWDQNTLVVAKRAGIYPTMKLAIAVGKEMLKERGVMG